jgi:hypothetical protein
MRRLSVLISAFLMFALAQLGMAQQYSATAKKEIAEIADLKRRIGKDSNNAELHYLLANAYVTVLRPDLAKTEYEDCIRLGPGSQAATYAVIALGNLRLPKAMASVNESASVSSIPQVNQVPIPQRPQISSIDTLSAPPGQPVTVVGTGFSAISSDIVIRVGGISAEVTSASPTRVTFLLPHTEGQYPAWNVRITLSVRNAPGEASTTINLQERIIPSNQ